MTPRSRRMIFLREVFFYSRPSNKGRRECRAADAPDSRVCKWVVKNAHTLVRSHRNHPAFPTQWFADYNVPSPVLGLFGHPHPRKFPSTNLTPASRCQDHTSSPSASSAFVKSTVGAPRIPPRVVDVAQRPFGGAGWEEYRGDFAYSEK